MPAGRVPVRSSGAASRYFAVSSLEAGERVSYDLPLDGPSPSLVFSWEDELGQAGALSLDGEQQGEARATLLEPGVVAAVGLEQHPRARGMRSRRTRCCGGRRRLGLGMPARVRMPRTVGRLRARPSCSSSSSVRWVWLAPGYRVAARRTTAAAMASGTPMCSLGSPAEAVRCPTSPWIATEARTARKRPGWPRSWRQRTTACPSPPC